MKIKKRKVDIVIIVYKPNSKIIRLIEKNIRLCPAIIVNNSGKELSFLKSTKNICIINNKINVGFALGMNQAIQLSSAEYILSINPDVELTSRYIDELISIAETNDRVGIVTGKILDYYNRKVIDRCGDLILKTRAGEENKQELTVVQEVFSASAAASLYRRSMLEDIKVEDEYFDADFFCYYEDLDLAWRARLLGWKVVYTPKAVAYHIGHSSGQSKAWIKAHSWKNRIWMTIKNDSWTYMLLDLPYIFLFELYYLLKYIYCYKYFPLILKKIPSMIRKRRVIQQKKQIRHSALRKYFKSPSLPNGL